MGSVTTIPVNPAYAPQVPDVTSQYANPVTLNNVLIEFSNAFGGVTQELVELTRREAKYKVRVKELENELEAMHRDMLVAFPAPTKDRQNKQLLDSYLETVAREQGMEERVIDLRRRLSDGRRLLLEVSADKDACELQLTYLKVASDNVRSHLSYVKVDITQGRGG